MDPIKVLLVNEVPLLGSIFSSVLTEEKDIDVAACVTSVESALAVLQQQQVDVAVVSIGLPDGGLGI
jgi:DNA-binding NarL/FixJ family response regulator